MNMPGKKYHVVKRKEDNKWTVKLEGSDKVIKLFDTKDEAMVYVKQLASNKGASIADRASKGVKKGRIQSK